MNYVRRTMIGIVAMFSLTALLLTGCDKPTTESCRHSYSKWVVEREPTCAKSGTQVRTCENCGEKETRRIKALAHQETITPPKSATCTEVGLTQGKHCSVCNEVLEEQTEIPSLSHDYVETITASASCSGSGSKSYACRNCSDTYTTEYTLSELDASTIYAQSSASIGEITTYDGNGKEYAIGTGFVYTADGQIITNYHVIEGAKSAKIAINGATYNVKYVLAYDKDIDLAVLQITGSFTPLPICYNTHAVGKTIYAYGSSRGLTATFSQGIITYASREIDGVSYVQHDAAISGGNSGGPLIDQYGSVIGINTWTVRDSQNLNFAIAPSEINKLRFGTKLTMEEFYKTACDPFETLKNYIIDNGKYSSSSNEYTLYMGTSYSSDYSSKYTRVAYYDLDNQEIQLGLWIDSDTLAYFKVDSFDGTYEWVYFDDSDNYMTGTMYASTFGSNTILSYSSQNISGSSLRTAVQKLASSMLRLSVAYLDEDLSAIGITHDDLLFYSM